MKKSFKERHKTEQLLVTPEEKVAEPVSVVEPLPVTKDVPFSESKALNEPAPVCQNGLDSLEPMPAVCGDDWQSDAVSDNAARYIETGVSNVIDVLTLPQNHIWLCLCCILLLSFTFAGGTWMVTAAIAIACAFAGWKFKGASEERRRLYKKALIKVMSNKRLLLQAGFIAATSYWLNFAAKSWYFYTYAPNHIGLLRDAYIYPAQCLLSRMGFVLFASVSVIWLFNRLLRKLSGQWLIWFNYSAVLMASFALCLAFVGVAPLGTPDGVGHWIFSWLNASLYDANLDFYSAAEYGTTFNWLVALLLYYLVGRPASALAQTFAIWSVQGRSSRSDNILRSFCDSIDTWHRKIVIAPAHPVLKHVAQSALTFVISYVTLYLLVVLCPGGLGDAMRNWLNGSLAEAIHMKHTDVLTAHPGLLHFMAGLVALWGAVPFGLMSLAFLPPARSSMLELRPWGVFYRRFWSILPFSRPVRNWDDFKSVTTVKGRSGAVVFKFYSGGSIKFLPDQISRADMFLLLSSIDEYAVDCTFDPGALALLKDLGQSQAHVERGGKVSGKTMQRKYSAMVFNPLSAGDTICDGTLRVVRQLSSKPLAAVYLVRTAQSRLAVLKQFALPSAPDDKQSQKINRLVSDFECECEILKQLNDPCISKVLSTFTQSGSHYLLLDYAPGRDLLGLVQEHGVFAEPECQRIAIAVAQIVQKLHHHVPAILHRDLTPDNLVITPEGQVRLIDFGSAHQFVEGITGTLVGKQAYIAPEQLRGKATVQSDIYSFGCCLSYLLTGEEPVALTQSDPRSAGAAISDKMDQLIRRCTAFEASDRPAHFDEILAILQDRQSIPEIEADVL